MMFTSELDFFIKNQDDLVRKYLGKFLVIKESTLLGVYDSPLLALVETQKEHPLGTFMIQPCLDGPDAYTVTISSINLFPSVSL